MKGVLIHTPQTSRGFKDPLIEFGIWGAWNCSKSSLYSLPIFLLSQELALFRNQLSITTPTPSHESALNTSLLAFKVHKNFKFNTLAGPESVKTFSTLTSQTLNPVKP